MQRQTMIAAACLQLALAASAAGFDYSSYRATKADVRTLEQGLSEALKMESELFPQGIGGVDIVLYDSRHVWLWSRSQRSLPKIGGFKGYTVYKVEHSGVVDARNMHGCRGSVSPLAEVALGRENVAEHVFECSPQSPWAVYHAKRSIYSDRDGYLTTITHEFGHQYLEQHGWNTPVVKRMWPEVRRLDHPKPYSVMGEAFATWCELRAARKLHPAFFAKLKADSSGPNRDPHVLGQKVALKFLDPSR